MCNFDALEDYLRVRPISAPKDSLEYQGRKIKAKIAYAILRRLIKENKVVRPEICSKCGRKDKIVAHHPDYNKPLWIEWLCKKCHDKEHRPDWQLVAFICSELWPSTCKSPLL